MQAWDLGVRWGLIVVGVLLPGVGAGVGALTAVALGKPVAQGASTGIFIGLGIDVLLLMYIVIVGLATGGSLRDEILGADTGDREISRLLRAERRQAKLRERDGTESGP
jgi:hypothetical protein